MGSSWYNGHMNTPRLWLGVLLYLIYALWPIGAFVLLYERIAPSMVGFDSLFLVIILAYVGVYLLSLLASIGFLRKRSAADILWQAALPTLLIVISEMTIPGAVTDTMLHGGMTFLGGVFLAYLLFSYIGLFFAKKAHDWRWYHYLVVHILELLFLIPTGYVLYLYGAYLTETIALSSTLEGLGILLSALIPLLFITYEYYRRIFSVRENSIK